MAMIEICDKTYDNDIKHKSTKQGADDLQTLIISSVLDDHERLVIM